MRGRSPRLALALVASMAIGVGVAPGAFSQTNPLAPAGAAKKGAPAASASAAAPAAPAAAPIPAPPAASSTVDVMPPPVVVRKVTPPPPAPSPQQLAGLQELEKEADTYEKAARDYRRTITGIIQHHYEDRRRRVLSALDNEIAVEKKGLRDAREEAIRRLEAFVAKYSGINAHPENTPDAMFRLAALYEERARTDTDSSEDLAVGLKPAVALYKRIIKEFPQYRELAGIYYYLGHAYNDSNRLPEAQQVWRSLICHNIYAYPTQPDPKDPDKDVVVRLPQDHDRDYWTGWEARHPTPIGGGGLGGKGAKVGRPAPPPSKKKGKEVASGNTSLDDEVSFRNPYPDACKPIPQKTAPGAEPRYLAEVWWLIGDYHFNEVDQAGGPFNYNRAEAAYQQSIKFKKPPVHGVSMYKLAWTYFKQQRYETSVRQFIDLLRYTDQQEKATGDTGADFRAEAYTYIAGSLTYLDFAGPAADEPYVPRNDILDVESDARIAEQRMRIALDRVQDPKLIPQNEKWTVDIYKALAQEFKELAQLHNNIEVDELILKKWPMHRDAPVVQSEIADIYDKLTAQSREGTAERKENAARALNARTKLSAYVGNTPWTDANKNDPEALQTADRLVHGGLRRAAADHTNAGSALVQQAIAIGDKESRDPLLDRALTEYKLAAQGWDGYLKQDTNASDAYESRYWLADANHNVVVILVLMDRSPSANEVDAARRTAIDVRDSNEDDKYLQPAAFMVVDTAQQVLKDQYKLYERTKGAQGIERRDAVKMAGEGEAATVVKDPVPAAVLGAIAARDEYIQHVPPAVDLAVPENVKEGGKNADLYAYDGADYYFTYGQFDDAKKRLEPIYRECKKNKTGWGYKAWSRLTDIAALMHDVPGSRKLAEEYEKDPCPTTPEQKIIADAKAKNIKSGGYYIDAYAAYQKAEKMPEGPDRVKMWREAGTLYQVALKNAPARDEAPEAAINGAYAYKQVGDYDQAIDMYALFIKEYGNEENLKKLDKGDPSVTPPKPADPTKYGVRVKYLKQAYDALSAAYVLFFNYRSAAESYDTISRNARFEKGARRDAALNAVLLYANIGDSAKMLATRSTFMTLDPPAEKKAEIDYLVASADLKGWDEHGLDEGANRSERLKAMAAMDTYYAQNKAKNEAAGFVVMAAYNSAKLRKAGRDPKATDWCKSTIGAFEKYRTTAKIVEGKNSAFGSLQADMAAECAFDAIDERIRAEFDYDTGHHRYAGVIDKVKKSFDDDIKKAEGYFNQLQDVITKFESRPWSVAAKARQGSLYDSCRTGLFNARPPGLKLYTEKEEKLLKLAETSGREDLQEQADAIRQKRREDWRGARERSLNDADKAMVKFYTEAVVFGRAFKVRNAAVDTAIQRLAFFTNILGDPKLREYSQGVVDPETKAPFQYSDGVFLRTRPGMAPPLKSDDLPAPLPVIP